MRADIEGRQQLHTRRALECARHARDGVVRGRAGRTPAGDEKETIADRVARMCQLAGTLFFYTVLGASILLIVLVIAQQASQYLRSTPVSLELSSPSPLQERPTPLQRPSPSSTSRVAATTESPTGKGELPTCFSRRKDWYGFDGDFVPISGGGGDPRVRRCIHYADSPAHKQSASAPPAAPSAPSASLRTKRLALVLRAPLTRFLIGAENIFERTTVPCKGTSDLYFNASCGGCHLPAFDAAAVLRALRGRTLFMLGDSLMHHQSDSLECLLGVRRLLCNPPNARGPASWHKTASLHIFLNGTRAVQC